MRGPRLRVLILGALVAPLIAAVVSSEPAVAAPAATPPPVPLAAPLHGGIAGYTVTPGSGVTSASVNVIAPTVVTSSDCNTPGQFEYSEFGLFFDGQTFARIDATCGNTGNVEYFCDIEAGGTLKIVVLKPDQLVRLTMTQAGGTATITMSRGLTFRQVSGRAGPFDTVYIGATYVPGFDIPVATNQGKFGQAAVNGQALNSIASTESALWNGVHVLMRPTSLTSTSNFSVNYLRQS